MKACSVFGAVFGVVLSLPLDAGEFTLKSAPQSLADWQNASFYDNGGGAPGVDDTVILPDNMTVKVDDDSIAFVGSFALIKPMGKRGSVLVVDIANDHDFGCAFYYAARKDNYDTDSHGTIVKTGAGCLSLKSVASPYDYFTDMDIQAGAIRLPCKTDAGFTSVEGRITVGQAGLLMPSANTANATTMSQMISLSGSGIVSNGVGTADQCRFQPWFGEKKPTEFSGRIVGNITYYGNGFTYLTGTESTFTGAFHPYYNCESTTYGIVGVEKFGNPGEPSSIGSGSVSIGMVGGRILYLGSGETTTKNIGFGDNSEGQGYATIMDAGANGGLTLTGQWAPNTYYKNQRLVLTGSNTADCVISGNIALNSTTRTYVTKKGTGTWKLADYARDGISGIAVDEGTLKFETLFVGNTASSLGDGKVKSEDTRKVVTPVAYDFRLGTATTAGALEFVGVKESGTASRPLVLAGDGILRNSGTNFSFRGGVSSIVSTPTTLTLDGDSAADSIISSVSNGTGVVSLAKTGAGTWVLDGTTNNTFTGEIAVKEGKLVLSGEGVGFEWLRWTLRGTFYSGIDNCKGKQPMQRVTELGFFDKDGMRVGANVVDASSSWGNFNIDEDLYHSVYAPGTCGFGRKLAYVNSVPHPQYLFDGTKDTLGAFRNAIKIDGAWADCSPLVERPDSYVTILVRLPKGANPVTHFDWARWGESFDTNPKDYLLEGSRDGYVWTTLIDETNGKNARSGSVSFQWAYNGSGGPNAVAMGVPGDPHPNGLEITAVTQAGTWTVSNAVSVASGATVEAEGKVQLMNLKVDANGAGTVKGFSFAEEGSVDVVNYNRTTALGLTFEDCTGTENFANWSVKCDGKDKPSKSLSFKNGVLSVESSGLTVIVR